MPCFGGMAWCILTGIQAASKLSCLTKKGCPVGFALNRIRPLEASP